MSGDGNERKAVSLNIYGRVQGVWYRGWTVDEAAARGLDGWVRNRADGSVEALVAGPPPEVEALVQRCWEGPSMAHVRDIVVKPARDPGPIGFSQESTR